MSTRMTKALRAEIAQAIYKASDLPARLERLERLPVVEAAPIIRSTWPAGFEEAIKNYPKAWFDSVKSIYIRTYTNRADATERIALEQDDIGRLYCSTLRLDDPVPYPSTNAHGKDYVVLVHEWLYDVYRPMYRAWGADRKKLMDSAYALLNSYRTVDALLKAAPELKQFVPTNTAYPLPVVPVANAISNFLERGVVFDPA